MSEAASAPAGPPVGIASGPLGVAQEADREISRRTAAQARALADFAADRPASVDRPAGTPGAMSAERRAARSELLVDVSEWAVQELSVALSMSSETAENLLVRSLLLVHHLPATLAALEAGALHVGHLRVLIDKLAALDPALRAELEAELLAWMSGRVTTPAQLAAKARRLLLVRDARGAADRLRRALRDRGVEFRPGAVEGMAEVKVLMSLPEARALVDALHRCADAVDDDPSQPQRTRGQKAVDCLLDLVLRPGETHLPVVQVQLMLVAAVESLLGGDTPGEIDGHPVPASVVRQLARALGLLSGDGPGARDDEPATVRSAAEAAALGGAHDAPSAGEPSRRGGPAPAAPLAAAASRGAESRGAASRGAASRGAEFAPAASSGDWPDGAPFEPPSEEGAEGVPGWTDPPWEKWSDGAPAWADPPWEEWSDGALAWADPPWVWEDPPWEELLAHWARTRPWEHDAVAIEPDGPAGVMTAAERPAGSWWATADAAVERAGLAVRDALTAVGHAERTVRDAETAADRDETAWADSPAGRMTTAGTTLAALRYATDEQIRELGALLRATGGGGLVDRPRIAVVDALSGTLLALTDTAELRRTAHCGRPGCARRPQRCTHDLTGRPGLGPPPETAGYRPGAALDRYVRARDRRCRFPGCRRRVPRGGELDHTTAWPDGPTAATNLTGYCTGHHRGKHQAPGWTHTQHPDGRLTVTTPTGLTTTTEPPPF